MIVVGGCPYSLIIFCPWCEEEISPILEGKDDFAAYWKCPKCGHRWEEWV